MGGDTVALSDAQRKANDRYITKAYSRLPVSYSKSYCAAVRAAAAESGESLAGYVRRALDERMQRDGFTPPAAPIDADARDG